MNEALFRWINNWPESLSPIFVFFSEATKTTAGRITFGLLVLLFLVSGPRPRKALFLGLAAVLISNELTDVIKHTWPVQRPCVELLGIHTPTGVLTSAGTASAHSANMAALAGVFVLVWGWRGTFWVPVALLTGLSRIYVGVHYPSQVLLGWICGVFASFVVVKTWDAWVIRRHDKEPKADLGEHRASPG